MSELTAARLRELLHYDAETGHFYWRQPCRGRRMGRPAGTKTADGYVEIMVELKVYPAHHLAWLYQHGRLPLDIIDHFNGQKADNRLANLREADRFRNAQNQRRAHAGSSTGFLGVSKCRSRFAAKITVDKKCRHIGVYDTPEEAHAAYVNAKRKYHEGCTL